MADEEQALEREVVGKLCRRIVPFLMVCYCVAYLDRVNVGFAALTMNGDLGLTSTVFGAGAGIFFFGYFLFEVPSNLVLARFGARTSLARIMICWGIVATGTAFVTGANSFYAIRFVLGAAEAGFFPGMLFFLTLWFPAAHRGRILGWFMASIPISVIIGSPVSGFLLTLDGRLGLHGWQWLYILEGLPAAILGVAVLFVLTDTPEQARWLTPAERDWLTARLLYERRGAEMVERLSAWRAVMNPRVLLLSLVYFGLITCTVGISFWLPQIVKTMGADNVATGFVTAVPSVAALAGMLTLGRRSDRVGERRFHCAFGFAVGALGLVASTLTDDPVLRIGAFSLAAFGLQGGQPIFWTIPAAQLTGTAAAAGLALINSLGGLAGFFGPTVIGMIRDRTGSFSLGMITLAAAATGAAVLIIAIGGQRSAPRDPLRMSQA